MSSKKFNGLFLVIVIIAIFIAGLFYLSTNNFLLFHILIEFVCVVIGCSIFIFAWNTHQQMDNHFFTWLGISFLFISVIDVLHLLSYQGMSLIPGIDANRPTQLWIAARFLQSATFLYGFAFLKRKCNPRYMMMGFIVIIILLLGLISLNFFPDCYHESDGLTIFKKYSEYLISFLYFISILKLFHTKEHFGSRTFLFLIFSLTFNIFAELLFTTYLTLTDVLNATGHIFKLIAYIFFYSAIIEVGVKRPQELLYRQILRKEELLKESLKTAEHIAVTDFLTGVYNRRYFVDQMVFELERANRYHRNISLLLIDLDDFKRVNDQYGHSIGDEVLQQFSQWLTKRLRQVDVVARYGGDEFVVLIPETDHDGLAEIMERLKEELQNHIFKTSTHQIKLRASFGAASFDDKTNTMDKMLNQADQELYRDKNH